MGNHFGIKGEHHLDGVTRVCKKQVKWVFSGDHGYEICIGTHSKKWIYFDFPKTDLLTCGICGKTSTPKKIVYHPPFTFDQRKRYGLEFFGQIKHLCWSCLNKMKPMERAIEETDKLRIEITRRKRKLNETTKNNA